MGHMDTIDREAEYDSVADVRAMRPRDLELEKAKWARVEAAAAGPEDPNVERRLLPTLGLDPEDPGAH